MKNIYVILPRSETFVAKIGRILTKYEYSHITISFDDELQTFYSFSRIYNDAPIISGFVKEYRSHLASKKDVKLKCKIFKIKVTDNEYKLIKKDFNDIKNNDKLMFNYISMILLPILGGVYIKDTYNCCHYVAKLLSNIKSIKFGKKLYKYKPKDFDMLLSEKYLYFDGYLNTNYEYNDDVYFNKISFKNKIKYSIRLIFEIIYRLLFKKSTKKFSINKIESGIK